MELGLDTLDHARSNSLTVRAYVRPSLLAAPVDGKIRTLEGLETEGVVDDVTVDAWPDSVRLDDEPTVPEVIEIFERFEEWANAAGTSIRPPFTVRTWSSEFTGETKRLLEPPLCCLAIERNGHLVSVVPHSDGDGHCSVTDALAALHTIDSTETRRRSAPDRVVRNSLPLCRRIPLRSGSVILEDRWPAENSYARPYEP